MTLERRQEPWRGSDDEIVATYSEPTGKTRISSWLFFWERVQHEVLDLVVVDLEMHNKQAMNLCEYIQGRRWV